MKLRMLMLVMFVYTSTLFAQQFGERDMTFNPVDNGTYGYGINEEEAYNNNTIQYESFNGAIQQADGKIVIVGLFDSYNDEAGLHNIMRINPDGSRDTTFNVGTGPNTSISDIKLLPSGKMLITGSFTSYNGADVYSVALLNQNGTLDTSFNYPGGEYVRGALIQPDGKIMIYGTPKARRINSDGSIDTTFNHPNLSFNVVHSVLLLANGQYIIAGDGTQKRIVRLNANGSVDSTFDHSINGSIYDAALQSDGKILIGGYFNNYDGSTVYAIARLNANGALDTTFNSGMGTQFIRSLKIINDDKILITGDFGSYNGINISRAARINTDGSLDTTFTASQGNDLSINTSLVLTDNSILFLGTFRYYDRYYTNGIVKTSQNGAVDVNFSPANGLDYSPDKIKVLPDGKMIVSGTFSRYNKDEVFSIMRLNADGSLDTSFNSIGNAPKQYVDISKIGDFEVLNDGKILIIGTVNYTSSTYGIHRLNANGSLDTTFNTGGLGTNFGGPATVASLSDGKILIGGSFQFYNNVSKKSIARLNSNGTLDSAFTFPAAYNGATVISLCVQPDGKILAAGKLKTNSDGTICSLIRLNSDGTLDNNFTPVISNPGFYIAVKILHDGKILLSGELSTVNGATVPGYVKLNSNGTIDTTFNLSQTLNPTYDKGLIEILPNGKLITCAYGGNSNSYYYKMQLLSNNGAVEYSKTLPVDYPNFAKITAIAAQQDNNIVVGGYFKKFNGVGVRNLTRIFGSDISSFAINSPAITEYCAGKAITLSYTATGTFSANNIFTAQLSDPFGNFENPVTIGSTASVVSGTINAVIPITVVSGTGYRIRITRTGNVTSPSVSNIDITINSTPAPTATQQTYCFGENVSALNAEGENLKWYASVTGQPIAGTTELNTANYYVTQTLNGCESAKTTVAVTINNTPAPTASAQSFCEDATTAELIAQGSNLIWYADGTNNQLDAATVLTTGIYYVTQTVNNCESARTTVNVTVNEVPPPSGESQQTVGAAATIADIDVTGQNLNWYITEAEADAEADEDALPLTTAVEDNQIYYVTQTIGNCTSEPLAVTVSVILHSDIFDNESFTYYPNPTNDVFFISANKTITIVSIYNLLGQQVMAATWNNTEGILDTSQLSSGSYIVKLTINNTQQTIKMIKL